MCRKKLFLITLVLVAVLVGSAPAANKFWDDGSGTNHLWSTPANWNPDGVPASADYAILNLAGTDNKCEVASGVSAVCSMLIVGYQNSTCYLQVIPKPSGVG